MPSVRLKYESEKFDSLIRRFRRVVDRENVLKDYAKHEFYEKPTTVRKRAKDAAKKRAKYNNR